MLAWPVRRTNAESLPVLTGLDMLEISNFSQLAQKKLIVFCNHGSRDSKGVHLLDILARQKSLRSVRTYVITANGWDRYWQDSLLLSIHSPDLKYVQSQSLRFRASELASADGILFDMPLSGISSDPVLQYLKSAMRLADLLDIALIIPDRPRMSALRDIWGPPNRSAAGLPFLYDMSLGEAARYFARRGYMKKTENLTVIPCRFSGEEVGYNDLLYLFYPQNPMLETGDDIHDYPFRFLASFSTLSVLRDSLSGLSGCWAPWMDAVRVKQALAEDDPAFAALGLLHCPLDPRSTMLPLDALDGRSALEVFLAEFRVMNVLYPREMQFRCSEMSQALGNGDLCQLLKGNASLQTLLHYWTPETREFILLRQASDTTSFQDQ